MQFHVLLSAATRADGESFQAAVAEAIKNSK